MQYPWAPHHMTPERRNIAADLAFVRHQNPPYIALMQYRVTLYEEDLECFPSFEIACIAVVNESILVLQYYKTAMYRRLLLNS